MPRVSRINSDEKYVLDLLAEILNEKYIWQKRFDNLLGDMGKSGRKVKLPVDAYFPKSSLIVEYKEKQHNQPVAIMDNRMTISEVHRGEQRKIYDLRKEEWALKNGFKFISIHFTDLSHKRNGRLTRERDNDIKVLEYLLNSSLLSEESE